MASVCDREITRAPPIRRRSDDEKRHILLGMAIILWVVAVQIDDVSFVDAYWGGGMALMAFVSWLRLYEPGPLATLLMAIACPLYISPILRD